MLVENLFKRVDMNYLMEYFNNQYIEMFCKECPNYGKVWTCPPHSFDLEETLRKYKTAYLVGTLIYSEELPEHIQKLVNKNPYDIEKATEIMMAEVRKKLDKELLRVEEEIPKSRAVFSGKCLFCPKCTREENNHCKNPKIMRVSLESFGFDICRICSEVLGVEIVWGLYDLPTYVILVSVILSEEEETDYSDIVEKHINAIEF